MRGQPRPELKQRDAQVTEGLVLRLIGGAGFAAGQRMKVVRIDVYKRGLCCQKQRPQQ